MLPPEPSPLDDPFNGRSFIEEAPAPPPPPRTGPGCGGLLGGCLEIVFIAAIVLLSCGTLSLVVVNLGQNRGVIAQPPAAQLHVLAQLPTVEPLNVPTLAAIIPTSIARPTSEPGAATQPEAPAQSEATTEPVCADAAAWWRDQQGAFDAFSVALAGLPFSGENPTAVYATLAPRRDSLSASSAPRCLETPQANLLRAMEATLSGLSAASAGDRTRTDEYAAQATTALAGVLTNLWDLGVFTAADAAPTRSIARSSGADCADEGWRAAFEPQWQAFRAAAATADPRVAPSLTMNLSIGQMNAITGQMAALTAPECAQDVERYATNWMTFTAEALTAHVAGEAASARAAAENAARALILLRTWEDWLGLAGV